VSVGAPGGQSIGVFAVVLGIFDAKIVEINGLVRLHTAERHHHVHKKADAVLMARNHRSGNIRVCRR